MSRAAQAVQEAVDKMRAATRLSIAPKPKTSPRGAPPTRKPVTKAPPRRAPSRSTPRTRTAPRGARARQPMVSGHLQNVAAAGSRVRLQFEQGAILLTPTAHGRAAVRLVVDALHRLITMPTIGDPPAPPLPDPPVID